MLSYNRPFSGVKEFISDRVGSIKVKQLDGLEDYFNWTFYDDNELKQEGLVATILPVTNAEAVLSYSLF